MAFINYRAITLIINQTTTIMPQANNTTDIKTLVFKRSLSPSQFMQEHKLDKIDVVINPHTGKRFFTTSNSDVSGKASKTDDYKENPVFSLCEDPEGEEFWMLHKQATDNVEHSFTI